MRRLKWNEYNGGNLHLAREAGARLAVRKIADGAWDVESSVDIVCQSVVAQQHADAKSQLVTLTVAKLRAFADELERCNG
jgi:hypothetical protein